MNITKRDIDSVMLDNNWEFMNKILYDMCSKYPTHTDTSIVMAKICLIGRSYSASIERRKTKPKTEDSDDFYEQKVAPKIMKSDIDKWLSSLKKYKKIRQECLPEILKTHFNVMKIFNKISGLNKRSLASKYLHFHLPKLLYIYDSRAIKGLRSILPRQKAINMLTGYDDEYSKFCYKLFSLQKQIENKHHKKLSTRQLDRLLLLKS